MPLRNRADASDVRLSGSTARGSEVPSKLAKTIGRVAAIPPPSPAALRHVQALAHGISKLWRVLAVAPIAPARHSQEHSHQVGLFSWNIARLMGLSEDDSRRIFQAAYLHDAGSAAVPKSIMLKSGNLTAEERGTMQRHPLISRELLRTFVPTRDLAGIALAHHERFDGDGYPNGLAGVKIPLEARILAIADSLDAMMSWRPYREPLSFRVALKEIKCEAGRQFDASIVEIVARKGKSLAWSPNAPTVSK
jgi:HD-GYP domain-containing protein (c-di-GMP phosphodiesterase class II)